MTTPPSIYGLTDLRSGEIRYVGKTVRKLEARLAQHVRDARKKTARTHCGSWITSIGAVNIGIIPLEVSPTDLAAAERRWIAELNADGRLTNLTPGGDGGSGQRSPETRAKISAALAGKSKSPEHVKRVSVALRGRVFSEETREKLREAHRRNPRRHSVEARQKISEGNRLAWLTRRGKGVGQNERLF